MIPAILALAVTAVVAVSLWEIITGFIEIIVGLVLMTTGALLYCLASVVEVVIRTVRFFWRLVSNSNR